MTPGEDIFAYAARINQACEEFQFDACTLDDFKTQMFTAGLKHHEAAPIRKKIMEKIDDVLARRQSETPAVTPKLTLNDVATLAKRMLTREEESRLIEHPTSIKQEVLAINRGTCKMDCRFCGEKHWHADCPFKTKKCTTCDATGHKSGYCDSAKAFKERQKKRMSSKKVQAVQRQSNSCRKTVRPKINGVTINMTHDSGSDWFIISKANWQRIGSPKLQPSSVQAISASGDSVKVAGYFSATVELKDKFGVVDCYVSNQGLNLFGNTALEALDLWNKPMTSYCDSITSSQTKLTDEVRRRFPKLFSKSLGRCNLYKASIKLKEGSHPPFIRARPVAYGAREAVEQAYDELVDQGVFTPINYAAAAAPVVIVKKKDGSIRVTADYSTGLNRAIETYNYPLPTPDAIFATLAGNDRFTTLDLSSAFHQIELDEEAKKLMAVNTHRGLFQVNRLQFGVKTAPGQFQQLMDTLLAGSGATAYLDDVIIPGRGDDDHHSRLMDVLERLENAGLRLRLDKCTFGQPSLKFLGKIIDEEGQRPDPEKLATIRDLPLPEDITQLRAFLGAINWYGNFIPGLKDLRGPLDDMLKKDSKFEWDNIRREAFKRLKQALHSDLALAHYDPTKPLVVAADASSYGIGAALLQRRDNGKLKPIQYAATSFSDTEKKYAQVEREALALVYAVKKFHRYIYGGRFELHTDHKPLLRIFGNKHGIPVHSANRLLRYAHTLLGYDFETKYIDNASFAYADFVSRLMHTHGRPGVEDIVIAHIRGSEQVSEMASPVIFMSNVIPFQHADLLQATDECKHLQKVREYAETHWPAIRKQIPDTEAVEYFPYRSDIRIVNKCIFLGDRPIIPPKLRGEVLKELHSGHPGASRMNALAREKCFWPGITQQISSYVQRCNNCATNAKSPIKEVLHPWPIPDNPWNRIHIDFAGPMNQDYFLVVVDAHSNWPEVYRMRTITTSHTLNVLREIFARWGTCRTIVSDNGPQFTSAAFKDFCSKNGIEHITSAPYHPQSNGRAEKFVDTLKRGIKKMEGEGDIDQKLQVFLAAYRGTPCLARDGKRDLCLFIMHMLQCSTNFLLALSILTHLPRSMLHMNSHLLFVLDKKLKEFSISIEV